jgi:hypothetical protein
MQLNTGARRVRATPRHIVSIAIDEYQAVRTAAGRN